MMISNVCKRFLANVRHTIVFFGDCFVCDVLGGQQAPGTMTCIWHCTLILNSEIILVWH